ncbi:glycosyl hydrolase [Parabacteroides leei]|uniref:glycosyl hydrolase n=1 Tax=Parabacteroides leei TaxID=2939491 RepID=UPI003241CB6D
MTLSRRTFIKSSVMSALSLPFIQGCRFVDSDNDENDRLFMLFQNPPVTSKPFVRWWWNGDKVTAKEILRELDVMKAAGIGGVEINPIRFPGGDDLGIPSLEWLSPEWIEMVKTALKGAEERGMICDIIVGSGWPFGGEFLQPEEQTQLMTQTAMKVSGPAKIELKAADLLKDASPQVASKYEGSTSELYSFCLAPVEMSTFAPAQDIPFDKGAEVIAIDIPEGEYILYVLVKVTGFQAVINGAPGAAGPVLNHYNQAAVEKFLNRMSDNLFPAISGLKGFRAMFCDSMELEGANWCHDFLEEFRSRRGYDVEPYLPFILYKVGHMGHAIEGAVATILTSQAKEEVDRVRYDFFVTCMDIVRDRFLKPYMQWCNKYNFKSRVQTYGREFHPLEASMEVDIPECETWFWNADSCEKDAFIKSPTDTNVNKFVASAAHYSGKRLVSCEEITNTDNVFNATLEKIKMTGDQSNLSGVTHSILHGFNYTPLEAPFPGWIMYGAFLNERNTWWPYFNLWAAYKSRVSTVLQESDFFADIAVMHPLADMWTIHGPQRDPFPGLHYPAYQYKVWEAIHRNGNSCDYISEGIIQKSSFKKGYLIFNKRKYHTLMLLEVESMMPATAEALFEFVKAGGKLIFVGKEPYKSPGYKDHQVNDEKVKQTIGRIRQSYPSLVFNVEAPVEMVPWFRQVQQQCNIVPYMKIDVPNPYVSQIRHQTEDKDIYFITNCNPEEEIRIQANFADNGKTPWLWNAETGERTPYPTSSAPGLQIVLGPAASQLIVFEKKKADKVTIPALPVKSLTPLSINRWNVRMEHINGDTKKLEIETLVDWSTDPVTRDFAGVLYYEKTIENAAGFYYLDLGKVYGVSEVILNGESLGCKWYGNRVYQLPEHLAQAPVKMLQIKITTTVGNYLKSTPDNKIGQAWTHYQKWLPTGMIGPVKFV